MKVIKKGEWRHFVICNECNAELLLNQSDLKFRGGTQNAGDREVFYCVCPECESNVEIPANELDDAIKKAAYAAAHAAHPRPPLTFKQ